MGDYIQITKTLNRKTKELIEELIIEVIIWIKINKKPEEVFDKEKLITWAYENEFERNI